MTDLCYICGEDNSNVLQKHHIIPRRLGGSDENENLVTLCANCHQAVESIYGDAFYEHIFRETQQKKTSDDVLESVVSFVEFCNEQDRVSYDNDCIWVQSVDELYSEYRDYCSARGLPAHTSKEKFRADIVEHTGQEFAKIV